MPQGTKGSFYLADFELALQNVVQLIPEAPKLYSSGPRMLIEKKFWCLRPNFFMVSAVSLGL